MAFRLYSVKIGVVFIIGMAAVLGLSVTTGWCRTYVSGTVLTADGKVVASGAVALEKGALHNNAFLAGGAIGANGRFKIPLPSGGPWGLHVYSEKYIYFPLQIQVTPGVDNEIPVILPVDGQPADDPVISDIHFSKLSGEVFQVRMQVNDPNGNLGPQMLAIDTRRFKSYRLVPQGGDLKDKKADFPAGVYVSPYIPAALDGEDLQNWLFVVADHQCSNGPVVNGLGQSVFKPPMVYSQKLTCEVAGIWKSNFDKIYRFSQPAPGQIAGEQFEGNLIIDRMVQKKNRLLVNFQLEGRKGESELELTCRENRVRLEGRYKLADKSGQWIFTKLKNAETAQTGRKLFEANCAACHFAHSKNNKIGPGLQGLFSSPRLPDSGRPTSEVAVRGQIVDGGRKMPPFKHLAPEQIVDIIEYLKSL